MNCHGCARDDETRWRVWVIDAETFIYYHSCKPDLSLSPVFPWHSNEFCWLLVPEIGLLYNGCNVRIFGHIFLKVHFPREKAKDEPQNLTSICRNSLRFDDYVFTSFWCYTSSQNSLRLHRCVLILRKVQNTARVGSIASAKRVHGNNPLLLPKLCKMMNSNLQSRRSS